MSDATQTTPSSLAALGARFATPWTITLLAPLLVGLLDPDQFVAVVRQVLKRSLRMHLRGARSE